MTSVTMERKQELLLKARSARLSWINENPSPYFDRLHEGENKRMEMETSFSLLKASRVGQVMENAVSIASMIYETDPMNDEFNEDGENLTVVDIANKFRQEVEITKTETEYDDGGNNAPMLRAYKEMISKLCLPECAELVNKMKHFVTTFEDNVESLEKKDGVDDSQEKKLSLLCTSMQKYLGTLYASIDSEPLWKNGDEVPSEMKESLEIFVFSKCRDSISKILMDSSMEEKDTAMGKRLDLLQFVKPSHLDLAFLTEDEWQTELAIPIAILKALPKLSAPTQILSCILDVHRGVNDSLSSMNVEDKQLAGADDLLPSLILTCIAAQPSHILSKLRFIEFFAEDQLKGEAGYAYTNFYCAVQFILELDLSDEEDSSNPSDEVDKHRPSLSISKEDLRMLIQKHRVGSEAPVEENPKINSINSKDNQKEDYTYSYALPSIPESEVRSARLRGEDMNTWARIWFKENFPDSNYFNNFTVEEDNEETKSTKNHKPPVISLPEGFKRSYNYLAADPKDLTIRDISALLKEYRMLAITSEFFLTDQAMRQSQYQKEKLKLARKRLKDDASQAAAEVGGWEDVQDII